MWNRWSPAAWRWSITAGSSGGGGGFEVTDANGDPDDLPQPGGDVILHLAERIKQSIPAKFLTEERLERERAD